MARIRCRWPAPTRRTTQGPLAWHPSTAQTPHRGVHSSPKFDIVVQPFEAPEAPLAPERVLHESIRSRWSYLDDLDDPRVSQKIALENEFVDDTFAAEPLVAMKTRFKNEMLGYSASPHSQELPEVRDGFVYSSSLAASGEGHPLYTRSRVGGGVGSLLSAAAAGVETVLDLNKVFAGHAYTVVGAFQPSPDPGQRFLAYAVDVMGNEAFQLRIRDIGKRSERVHESVDNVSSVVWGPYKPGQAMELYYVLRNERQRSCAVYRHILGQPATSDTLVFQEADESKHVEVIASKDRQMVTINVNSRDTSDLYLVAYQGAHAGSPTFPLVNDVATAAVASSESSEPDATSPESSEADATSTPSAVTSQRVCSVLRIPPPIPNAQCFVAHNSGRLYLVTNAHDAVRYKIMQSSISRILASAQASGPGRGAGAAEANASGSSDGSSSSTSCRPELWDEFLPHDEHATLHDIDMFSTFMVVFETVDTKPRLRVVSIPTATTTSRSEAPSLAAEPTQIKPKRFKRIRDKRGTPPSPLGSASASVATSDARNEDVFIPMPEDACDVVGGANASHASDSFTYSVLSTLHPPRDFAYTHSTGTTAPLREQGVGVAPGRPLYCAADYVSYELHSPSRDGTLVPMTVIHRTDLGVDVSEVRDRSSRLCSEGSHTALLAAVAGLDDWRTLVSPQHADTSAGNGNGAGSQSVTGWLAAVATWALTRRSAASAGGATRPFHPTQMHVYGCYGHPLSPEFVSFRLPLLSRGWVMAFAHVRGGGELGSPWYHAGRLEHKHNTFADATACARMLIASGLTRSDVLTCRGESAGGLVSGVLANTQPGLFRSHVMRVPFLNVLDDLLRPELPLSVPEYQEFGDPRDPAVAAYIASYDPMRNVQVGQRYPDILAIGGLEDARVPPYHPLKYVNLVREAQGIPQPYTSDEPLSSGTASSGPLLLCQVLEEAGHFGQGGRDERMEDKALEATFLCHSLRINLDNDALL